MLRRPTPGSGGHHRVRHAVREERRGPKRDQVDGSRRQFHAVARQRLGIGERDRDHADREEPFAGHYNGRRHKVAGEMRHRAAESRGEAYQARHTRHPDVVVRVQGAAGQVFDGGKAETQGGRAPVELAAQEEHLDERHTRTVVAVLVEEEPERGESTR